MLKLEFIRVKIIKLQNAKRRKLHEFQFRLEVKYLSFEVTATA